MADFNATGISREVFSQSANLNYRGIVPAGSSTPAATLYTQRVWCPPLDVWCYYIGVINPSPAPGDTTPNWVGSIERHQVLARVGT